jgi:hypothetical protein
VFRDASLLAILSVPLLLLLLIGHCAVARSQSSPRMESARSVALGSSVVALTGGDANDLNPAIASVIGDKPFALASGTSPFIAGLDNAIILRAGVEYFQPTLATTIGLGFARFGYASIYSDQALQVSAGRAFVLSDDRNAAFGARLRYRTIGFGNSYPSISKALFDLGLRFDLTSTISIGASAENILQSGYTLLDGTRDPLNASFHFGIAHRPAPGNTVLLVAIEDDVQHGLRGHFGAEYSIEHYLFLRVGAATDPGNITGGVGIAYGSLRLDASALYQNLTGTSLTFDLRWAW